MRLWLYIFAVQMLRKRRVGFLGEKKNVVCRVQHNESANVGPL